MHADNLKNLTYGCAIESLRSRLRQPEARKRYTSATALNKKSDFHSRPPNAAFSHDFTKEIERSTLPLKDLFAKLCCCFALAKINLGQIDAWFVDEYAFICKNKSKEIGIFER